MIVIQIRSLDSHLGVNVYTSVFARNRERGEVAGHARYLSKRGIVLKTQEMLLNLGIKRDYENYGG